MMSEDSFVDIFKHGAAIWLSIHRNGGIRFEVFIFLSDLHRVGIPPPLLGLVLIILLVKHYGEDGRIVSGDSASARVEMFIVEIDSSKTTRVGNFKNI